MSWPASSLTLAIDGSTPGPSVALTRGADVVAENTATPEPRRGRRLMEMVHEVMVEADATPADLGGVVVGVGPGGFTGLRIALATAAGIAQGRGIELVGASSLEALALGIGRRTEDARFLAPATDARRREVFAAIYERDAGGELVAVMPPAALSPEEFGERLRQCDGVVVGAGTGFSAYSDEIGGGATLVDAHHPAASDLVRRVIAGAGCPAAAEYLRLPDAETNRRRDAGES